MVTVVAEKVTNSAVNSPTGAAKIDVAFFLPSLVGGGAERAMLNLAIGFANQGFGVDIVLVKAKGDYLSEVPDNVRVVDLNATRLILSLPQFVQYMRNNRPTVMISAMEDTNLVAILAKKIADVPTRMIVSVQNQISLEAKHSNDLKRKVVPYLLRWFYPMANGIVAASQGVAEDLATISGVSPDLIQTIYNPIVTDSLMEKVNQSANHPWLRLDDSNDLSRDNLFDDPSMERSPNTIERSPANRDPVILAVGRLTAQKDFPTLLRAFAKLRQVQPAKLIILGEGEERSQLEALIEQLGLSSVVSLPGFVPNPCAFMSQAQVFVLSSAWEGFGNVLVESLAAGTPIVSTDCPSGPSEILADGRYGKLVPVGDVTQLADAMLETIQTRSSPQVLRERSQLFSLERVLEQYRQLANLPVQQAVK
jgi:glycosyltransferase involved in cell wall biosynthesis